MYPKAGTVRDGSIIERCRGLPIRLKITPENVSVGSYRRYPSISAWTLRDIPLASTTSTTGACRIRATWAVLARSDAIHTIIHTHDAFDHRNICTFSCPDKCVNTSLLSHHEGIKVP